jgi:hypothetical protein
VLFKRLEFVIADRRGRGSWLPQLFAVAFVLLPEPLSHPASQLTLQLMKASHLLGGEDRSNFSADSRFEPNSFRLRLSQLLGCASDGFRIVLLAHDRAIERLTRLPDAPAGADPLVLVIAANPLDPLALFRAEPYSLHEPLLKQLPPHLIDAGPGPRRRALAIYARPAASPSLTKLRKKARSVCRPGRDLPDNRQTEPDQYQTGCKRRQDLTPQTDNPVGHLTI